MLVSICTNKIYNKRYGTRTLRCLPKNGQLLGLGLVVHIGSLGEQRQSVHHLAQAPPGAHKAAHAPATSSGSWRQNQEVEAFTLWQPRVTQRFHLELHQLHLDGGLLGRQALFRGCWRRRGCRLHTWKLDICASRFFTRNIKNSVDKGHGIGHDKTKYAQCSGTGNLEDVLDVSPGVGHDRTKYVPVLAAWRMCWTWALVLGMTGLNTYRYWWTEGFAGREPWCWAWQDLACQGGNSCGRPGTGAPDIPDIKGIVTQEQWNGLCLVKMAKISVLSSFFREIFMFLWMFDNFLSRS